MKHHLKKLLGKKTVIGICSAVAVTGTVVGTQWNKTEETTRYVLAAVTRGTLITSVSGSGHVSAENQLDVTPGASGAVTGVFVKAGEEIAEGAPIADIDRRDAVRTMRLAAQSVRDAEISLESAKIAYKKIVRPDSSASVLQAQNAVNQAQRNLDKLLADPDDLDVLNAREKVRVAENDAKLAADGVTPKTVRDAYDKTVGALETLLNTTQNALDDANDILAVEGNAPNIYLTQLFSVLDQSRKVLAYTSYPYAKDTIEKARDAIEPLAIRDEDPQKINAAIPLMRDAIDATATLLKNVKNGLESTLTSSSFSPSSLDQYASTIQNDIAQMTTANATLFSQEEALDDAWDAYANAQTNVTRTKAELAELLAGPDPDDVASARETLEERKRALADAQSGVEDIDIKVALNTIEQRKSSLANAMDTLAEAQESLNDYTVRAPFDGVIAKVSVHPSDKVSQSTVLATVLTKAKIAEITVNEVDVAKTAVGQKATLSFDAVPDITIAGTVGEVDMVGTTNQGVVTYTVKIAFLTDDERIRPGMSVSASIATDVKTDVLLIPNGAVRQSGQDATVQVLKNVDAQAAANAQGVTSKDGPETRQVVAGASNDQMTVITEGLAEGEFVVTRTVDPSAVSTSAASATARSSSIRIQGAGFGTFTSGPPR